MIIGEVSHDLTFWFGEFALVCLCGLLVVVALCIVKVLNLCF
jgi:hypothetical protein